MDGKQLKNIILWTVIYLVLYVLAAIALGVILLILQNVLSMSLPANTNFFLFLIVLFLLAVFCGKQAAKQLNLNKNKATIHGFLVGMSIALIITILYAVVPQENKYDLTLLPLFIIGTSLGGYLAGKK